MISLVGMIIFILFIVINYPIQKYIKKKYKIISLTEKYSRKRLLFLALLNLLPPTFAAIIYILFDLRDTNTIFAIIIYCLITFVGYSLLDLFY
jgi:hypothetical protein